MTSKLVVNTIEADTGISSVSFASSISLSSTSKFFFGDAGIDIGPDTNINRPATGVLGFNINGSEKVRIASDGKVGINTTNPNHTLHVFGQGTTLAIFGDEDSGSYEALGISNAESSYPAITQESSVDTLDLRSYGSVQATIDANNNSTGKYFRVMTNGTGGAGTELFRVGDDGLVGIGTNNPASRLDVYDTSALGIISRSATTQATDTNKALRVRNNSGVDRFSVSYKGFTEIRRGEIGTYLKVGGDDAGNGRALTFTSSNTASNGALHTLEAISGNGAIALATAGTERFRVDRDGYVTMPYRPAFKIGIMSQNSPNSGVVSENNGFTLKDGSSGDTLRDAFNTGDHFDQATGRFTAPVTGLYFFHFSVMRASSSGSGSMDLRIKKNTALMLARSYRANYSTEGNFASMNVTTITNMTAGHYIEFVLGANMSVYEDDSYMLGYLLG